MTDEPIELDQRRGMAAQKATGSRRLMAQVEANERALRERREDVIGLYAANLGAGDTQRHTLVAAVLADFERLAAEEARAPVSP